MNFCDEAVSNFLSQVRHSLADNTFSRKMFPLLLYLRHKYSHWDVGATTEIRHIAQ